MKSAASVSRAPPGGAAGGSSGANNGSGSGSNSSGTPAALRDILQERGIEVMKFPRGGGTPEQRVIYLDPINHILYWVGSGGKRNSLGLKDVTSVDLPECNPDGRSIRSESRAIRRHGDPKLVDAYISLLTARDSGRDQLDIQLIDASARDGIVRALQEQIRAARPVAAAAAASTSSSTA